MVALGTALVLVTYVTPMASIPTTSAALDAGPGGRAWILSSMSVGLAGALLLSGALGDALGRRRVYVLGLAALGVGALACAASTTTGLFVAARVLEGIGGGAVLACGLAMLSATHDGPARGHATAVWGASVGIGISLGAVVPAVLEFGSGWRETYVVVGVLSLALTLPTIRLVPESAAVTARRIDLPGVLTLCAAMAALVSGLTEARSGVSPLAIALLLAALLLTAAFGVVETHTAQPLVDLHLLRSPGFAAATLGALTTGVGIIGMTSNVPSVLQVGLGHPLWQATGTVLVWSLAGVATSLVVRRTPIPWSGHTTLAAALAVVGGGQLLALGAAQAGSEWRLGPALLVAGLASGVLNAVLGREAVASVPADRAAMGSGSNNTARYLGAAIGITMFTVLARTGPTTSPADVSAGWNVAVLVSAAVSLVGALVVALVGRPRATA